MKENVQNNDEFFLINAILSEDVMEAWQIFLDNREKLKDWRFVGCINYPCQNINSIIWTNEIYSEYWLINFFKYNYLYFISDKVSSVGDIQAFIDYSVSLDTQILSYMKRFIFNAKENIPGNFYKVLDYLIKNDVNVDPFEYLYENIGNFKKYKSDMEMTLYAYEIFKNVDKNYWLSNSLLVSKLSHIEIMKRVKSNLQEIENIFDFYEERISTIYDMMYLCLLKMVIIELEYSTKVWYFKLNIFLEFLHGTVGVMAHREIIIAKEYFKKGHNLRFFKKINKKMKNGLNILKNMAWDLYHLRNIERNSLYYVSGEEYFISCLLSFDFGLIEIAKLCSIKIMALNSKKQKLFIRYAEMDTIIDDDRFSKWFSEETFDVRKPLKNVQKEIEVLEKALEEIINLEMNKNEA